MSKEFSTFADGSDCKECAALERKITSLTARLAAAEAELAKIALDHEGPASIAWDALGNPRTGDLWKMIEAAKGGRDDL